MVECLSPLGLTQAPGQVPIDTSKKCFSVCACAHIRADSSGHTRNVCLQSLFNGNRRLHIGRSPSLDTRWMFSHCDTPDNKRVHNMLLTLR